MNLVLVSTWKDDSEASLSESFSNMWSPAYQVQGLDPHDVPAEGGFISHEVSVSMIVNDIKLAFDVGLPDTNIPMLEGFGGHNFTYLPPDSPLIF